MENKHDTQQEQSLEQIHGKKVGQAYKWDRFFAILEKNKFNIRKSCREMGISSSTFYRWNKDPLFKNRYKEHMMELVMEAEDSHRLLRVGIPMRDKDENGNWKIVGWVEKPDREAIQFFLKCHGEWNPKQLPAEYQPTINIHIDNQEQADILDSIGQEP